MVAFIPVIGDFIVAFLSYSLIIRIAAKADLPSSLSRQMVLNNVIGVGLSYVQVLLHIHPEKLTIRACYSHYIHDLPYFAFATRILICAAIPSLE